MSKRKNRKSTHRKVNREYKSDVFKMYFSIKKNALDLYNALNNTNYTDENELVINTLEHSVFMKIYNDVSFVISGTINLYEHQSSVNPNMPLRDLFYITELYKTSTPHKDLYGTRLINVPTPKFVVFYNGAANISDVQTLKLSDSYITKTDNPELELIVQVLNVNYGHNRALMEKCIPLREYSILNQRIKDNINAGNNIEEAVTRAVDSCIEDHIMEDFLLREKAGVIKMHVLDFNEKLHNQSLLEEGREEGRKEGRIDFIRNMLANGKTPKEISDFCGIPLDTVLNAQKINI